jgi:hypothetical protein
MYHKNMEKTNTLLLHILDAVTHVKGNPNKKMQVIHLIYSYFRAETVGGHLEHLLSIWQ